MKGINFRFMLIHVANGGDRDLPQRSRIFTSATHNAILLRATSLRGKVVCRRVHIRVVCPRVVSSGLCTRARFHLPALRSYADLVPAPKKKQVT